jgi:hypothetical protein
MQKLKKCFRVIPLNLPAESVAELYSVTPPATWRVGVSIHYVLEAETIRRGGQLDIF